MIGCLATVLLILKWTAEAEEPGQSRRGQLLTKFTVVRAKGLSAMSRLRIRNRIARKTRALVMLQCRSLFEAYSEMWFAYDLAFMGRLGKRRDVTAFFSPQDCVNFLRFTQSQVQ